jgi:hypothetical protein
MPEPQDAITVDDATPGAGAVSSRSRGRRARMAFILVAVLGCVALVWLAVMFVSLRQTEVFQGETVYAFGDLWGYDYEAYLSATQRLSETGSPYQSQLLAGPYRPGPHGLYMYSPVLAVHLLPVAGLSLADGSALWFLAHVLALAAACALMPVRLPIRVTVFAVATFSYAVGKDLGLGNVSVMLLLPLAMTWRWLDRPLGAAALAWTMAVRPSFGVVLLWQLLRRQWSAVAWTIVAGLGLVALTLPFVGIQGYVDYLTVLANMTDVTGVRNNRDLSTTLLDLGADGGVARLGLMAGYALGIGAILLSLRRDRELGYMITLTASLILSPLLWDHYLALLVLPAALLAQRWTPLAVAIPLLSWLPTGLHALAVLAVLALLLVAPPPVEATSSEDEPIERGTLGHPVGA